MPFVLELENFQGPFDLLLNLLDKQKLEITEISLSKITDDYLDYISQMNLTIEEMNSFLYIAAKLSLDKSRAVINIPDTEDEIDLTESLKQYQLIKKQAQILAKFSKGRMYSRQKNLYKNTKTAEILPLELTSIYSSILKNLELSQKTHTLKNNKDYLDKAKVKFNIHVSRLREYSIDEIMSVPKNRTEAIVFFMSILELIKKQHISGQANILIGTSK
ncbi:segregation/condensation protein A [Candidatus Saccharibacteria bacterium]|nr:segregation/condensation protein A [Candidatus Saccharibacteria bacterium]